MSPNYLSLPTVYEVPELVERIIKEDISEYKNGNYQVIRQRRILGPEMEKGVIMAQVEIRNLRNGYTDEYVAYLHI